MKLFNNHSGLRGLPRFAEGIYWATGLSLTTRAPFTEGCPGVNDKASPPGRHQEQAPKQRCTFRPTSFSSVQSIKPRPLSVIRNRRLNSVALLVPLRSDQFSTPFVLELRQA